MYGDVVGAHGDNDGDGGGMIADLINFFSFWGGFRRTAGGSDSDSEIRNP